MLISSIAEVHVGYIKRTEAYRVVSLFFAFLLIIVFLFTFFVVNFYKASACARIHSAILYYQFGLYVCLSVTLWFCI